MAKRYDMTNKSFLGKEQSNIRQFLLRLFEENRTSEDALSELRNKFDAEDFVRVRELWARINASSLKEVRGPRGKN
jgi:hypothetical protein